MPDCQVALRLIHEVGRPIATTSANISGEPAAIDAEEVKKSLSQEIDLLLDGGKCPQAQVSTVVDLSGERPVVSRQGAISTSLIMELLS
jgi:tRNA threonylcarbamoyl adenosine modification protein (Sua5/YciO/YrdC/YwlC family)